MGMARMTNCNAVPPAETDLAQTDAIEPATFKYPMMMQR